MNWISVKEALPEMKDEDICLSSGCVLAWDGQNQFVAIRWKFKNKKEEYFKSTVCDCCSPWIGKITHWMPLPQEPV